MQLTNLIVTIVFGIVLVLFLALLVYAFIDSYKNM